MKRTRKAILNDVKSIMIKSNRVKYGDKEKIFNLLYELRKLKEEYDKLNVLEFVKCISNSFTKKSTPYAIDKNNEFHIKDYYKKRDYNG